MSWTSGEVINTTARLRRLSSAIPSSYTISQIGATYYGETNIAGGTDYNDPNCGTLINLVQAALASGGHIHFKGDTTYPLTVEPVISNNNILVTGDGASTVLRVADSTAINALKVTGDDVTVKDLTLDGNTAGNTDGGNGALQNGVYSMNAERTTVANCSVINLVRRGIYTSGIGNNHRIFGNYVNTPSDDHAAIMTDDEYVIIANNILVGSGNNWAAGTEQSDGVTLYESLYCSIVGNTIKDFCRRGVYCVETGAVAGGHSITGNTIENSGEYGMLIAAGQTVVSNNVVLAPRKHGIYLDGYGFACVGNYVFGSETQQGIAASGCWDGTISGNTSDGNYNAGILVDNGSTDLTINGNLCKNNSQVGAGTSSGIDLNGATDITLLGNRCFDDQGAKTQRCGIRVYGGSDYVIIQGNACRGNQSSSYDVSGDHNTYDAKIVSDAVLINGATTTGVMSFKQPAWLARAYLLYETVVANDTNVEVGYGDVGGVDRDKYVASVTSGTGAIWETEALTLLATKDIGALDAVTLYQDGSGGGGELIRLVIDVLYGA